jgi:SMC interacting uncharacterized protein involved in chromosome segregation
MRKKWILVAMTMVLFSGMVTAQAVTKDSINALKNEKEILKIARQLNEHKLKLAGLQNEVGPKTNDVQRTADEAQKAAAENEQVAANLSNDPQDKGKAKAASKAADNAEKSAKQARKAVDKLADLNNDIKELEKKIYEDNQKLIGLGGEAYIKPAN